MRKILCVAAIFVLSACDPGPANDPVVTPVCPENEPDCLEEDENEGIIFACEDGEVCP